MTQVLVGPQDAAGSGALTLPEPAACFHVPGGALFPFQVDGVARTYWQMTEGEQVQDALWDTGLGKSLLAMATAAMLYEDDLIDQVVVVAEANKVTDWANDDFPRFTSLTSRRYVGTPAKRKKILADPPQVLVMTYETGRNDICTFKPRSKAVLADGPLTEFLLGQRTLIVFDEVSRLRSRSALLYVAWDYLVNRRLRRDEGSSVRLIGLTATKVEKDPEDHFNANRLLAPWLSPSVEQFHVDHVAAWDLYGNPARWMNLTTSGCDPQVIPLSQRYRSITLHKRKTDPDVIEQFPAKMENPPRYVDLGKTQREFYDEVYDILSPSEDEEPDMAVLNASFGIMRQIAGDPLALTRSKGALARQIVEIVGADGLAKMGSAKVKEMLGWLRTKGDEQCVIFTFFGQSILPRLHEQIRAHGYSVVVNHGQMGMDERQAAQDAFRAGDAQVFLSSDAGARGLNLGTGSALLHYEAPMLDSTFIQRSDRIHRINSVHPSVTIDSLVATGTVKEAIVELLLRRNDWGVAVTQDIATEDVDPNQEKIPPSLRRLLWSRAGRQR